MEPLDIKDKMDAAPKEVIVLSKNARTIALFTALFALVASVANLMAARCTTRAIMQKNEAIILQSQVSDAWAYYQSKNIRSEITQVLAGDKHKDRIAELEKDKSDLMNKARELEALRDGHNRKSDAYSEVSKTFASAVTFLNSALILIPLTMLVDQLLLLYVGVSLGSVGSILLVVGYARFFPIL